MTTATGRGILAVVIALVFLLLGVGVGLLTTDVGQPSTGAADREFATTWIARVLLVLALAWIVIGMLAARTRLVRRPGAAAARSAWLASTRPWRTRESTLGMMTLDRVLLVVIPVGLLLTTRVVQTSFLSSLPLFLLFAWVVFVGAARLALGVRRSPYPLIAAVGGVVVFRCVLVLLVDSVTGPEGFWSVIWAEPALRVTYVALEIALFLWAFAAAGWAVSVQVGVRRAYGVVITGMGAGLIVLGIAAAVVPADGLPLAAGAVAAGWWAAGIGAVVAVIGGALARPTAS